MLGIGSSDPDKLVSLRFADARTFARAARVAAQKRIPVDAPGHHTLIVRKSDSRFFAALRPKKQGVADPEKVPAKELTALRQLHMR